VIFEGHFSTAVTLLTCDLLAKLFLVTVTVDLGTELTSCSSMPFLTFSQQCQVLMAKFIIITIIIRRLITHAISEYMTECYNHVNINFSKFNILQ